MKIDKRISDLSLKIGKLLKQKAGKIELTEVNEEVLLLKEKAHTHPHHTALDKYSADANGVPTYDGKRIHAEEPPTVSGWDNGSAYDKTFIYKKDDVVYNPETKKYYIRNEDSTVAEATFVAGNWTETLEVPIKAVAQKDGTMIDPTLWGRIKMNVYDQNITKWATDESILTELNSGRWDTEASSNRGVKLLVKQSDDLMKKELEKIKAPEDGKSYVTKNGEWEDVSLSEEAYGDKVASSYVGLVKNGALSMGNNTGFIPSRTHVFTKDYAGEALASGVIQLDAYVPGSTVPFAINPQNTYEISMDVLFKSKDGGYGAVNPAMARLYPFADFFDASGKQLTALNVMDASGTPMFNSKGVSGIMYVTQKVNAGDTVIHVEENFLTTEATASIYEKGLFSGPYVSDGVTYTKSAYMRDSIASSHKADLIDFDKCTLTEIYLKSPIPENAAIIEQSKDVTTYKRCFIRQRNAGGTYLYMYNKMIKGTEIYKNRPAIDHSKVDEWHTISYRVGGIAPWAPGKFPHGTAKMAIGWLASHGGTAEHTMLITNVQCNRVLN